MSDLISEANNFANRSLSPEEHDIWKGIKAALKAKDAEIEMLKAAIDADVKYIASADEEIERLHAVVDAAQQFTEQGLPVKMTREQWHAWHILTDALVENNDEVSA